MKRGTKKTGKTAARSSKADLSPRNGKNVKGGAAVKAAATTTKTPAPAIEITDYGFGVTMPVTSS